MRDPFAHGVGGVLSADIAVPDYERELGFYSAILTTGTNPLWQEDLTNNKGTPIIGLGPRTPEYESLPLQWMPHFQVADVSASVARALELGGKELFRSSEDHGPNQWAVLADTAGAAFGLIPVVAAEESPAKSNERSGSIVWLTLAVQDVVSVRNFYQEVIGWSAKAIAHKDGDEHSAGFEMQRDSEISAAEICGNHGDYEGIPAVWLICLPVDDLEESLRQVPANGGEVVTQIAATNTAIVRDPVGVYIALRNG